MIVRELFVAVSVITLVTTVTLYVLRTQRERRALQDLLAEQELKALRAQLDPHMLQNSFEIMASRIIHQNVDSAISFIRQVSAYLRFILHVSDKSIISLEEDLEFTEKYLSLQRAIANGSIQYTITVDDNIDTFGIDVPCMMLQPIVENSIRHGFKNTPDKPGLISIEVCAAENEVVCTLSDNGVGLPQGVGNKERISKGLKLTIKRLELLYRKSKRRPYMEVKSNKNGGVTTIIKIPTI